MKRITLFPIRNGIFMDKETFFVSPTSQKATMIVSVIILVIFFLKVLMLNKID